MTEKEFAWCTDPRTGEKVRKVTSVYGNEYYVGKKLGKGGVAKVFNASYANKQGPELVFKEYLPKGDPKTRLKQIEIRKNIVQLLKKPILDSKGNVLAQLIPPIDIVELPESNSFGYVMRKVDTKTYIPMEKLWHKTVHKDGSVTYDNYPGADVLCKFCKSFVEFFKVIHLCGWCYKDINEGNIYINPKNGDFYVIDCDNISLASRKTILGTEKFIAPEVYKNTTPDTYSDFFSIAAYLFRLFTKAYPMDGPSVDHYLKVNNVYIDEVASEVYGTRAVFAFNPYNKTNAMYLSNATFYKEVTERWINLPVSVKKNFIQTFVHALPYDKRLQRTNDYTWMRTFEDIEKNHLVKCKHLTCRCYNFDSAKTCIKCGKKMYPPPPPVNNLDQNKNSTKKQIYEVVFEYIAAINGNQKKGQIAFDLDKKITGKMLHPDFPNIPYFEAHYLSQYDQYTIKNFTNQTWDVERKLPDGKVNRNVCAPGKEIPIKTNVIIKIDKTRYVLKVLGKREKKK